VHSGASVEHRSSAELKPPDLRPAAALLSFLGIVATSSHP